MSNTAGAPPREDAYLSTEQPEAERVFANLPLAAATESADASPNSGRSRLARLGDVVAPQDDQVWKRLPWSILHLAAMASVGSAVVFVVGVLFFFGTIATPLLGVGLVLLVSALYVILGAAAVEIERVRVLYGIDVPPLRRIKGEGEGFEPFARMVMAQLKDLRMWRAFLSFVVTAILGVIMLFALMVVGGGLALCFSFFRSGSTELPWGSLVPGPVGSVVGVLMVLLAGVVIVSVALLQSVVVRNLAVLPSRDSLNKAMQTRTVQREGAVRAADVERTRIERDLHDGVQPRLVSVAITLGMAQKKIETDPDAARELVSEAHTSIKAAITELRQLARGIHTSVLDDRGLDAALSALAGRSHIPVTMDVRMEGREELVADDETSANFRDAEAACYFAIAESLTNAAKHSRASECRVVVRLRTPGPNATLWARVEDNGIGGAEIIPGGGLDGIRNRILAAGGTTSFVSPIGGPTALEVDVPCAS